MKKIKILFASVLFCVMGYTGYTAHEYATMSDAEKMMKANIEALTQDEGGGVNNPVGRWRTVGCGGRAFSQWKTYCFAHGYFLELLARQRYRTDRRIGPTSNRDCQKTGSEHAQLPPYDRCA